MPSEGHIEDVREYKRELASVLLSVAPGVRVKLNDYFNNSFAPDMTLTWPHDEHVRYVYLKTSANPEYLTEDVRSASLTPAIFIVLGDVATTRDSAKALQAALRGTGALMVEEGTLHALPFLSGSERLLRSGQGFRRMRLASV
jgi:hypothetical protein